MKRIITLAAAVLGLCLQAFAAKPEAPVLALGANGALTIANRQAGTSYKYSVSVPERLSLTAAHPRLILDNKALSAIKKAVAAGENEALVKMHSTYMDFASSCVEGAHKFEFIRSGSVPSRLLPVSRKALGEMAACAYAYRFSGEKK